MMISTSAAVASAVSWSPSRSG